MDAETGGRDELRARRISTEDMIRIQLAEINRLRSNVKDPDRVQAWSEAQEALVDLLEPFANDPADEGQFHREWAKRRVRVVRLRHPSGDKRKDRLVPAPTARDCREAQRIIMRLLDRHGLLLKRRNVSGPQPRQDQKTGSSEGPATVGGR